MSECNTTYMEISFKGRSYQPRVHRFIYSSTIMAETYEFPPSLTDYRPLQYERTGIYPPMLKLRHHFFLTRIKIVFKEMVSLPTTIREDWFFHEEMVSYSVSILKHLLILAIAERPHQSWMVCCTWCASSDSVFCPGIPAWKF
jgi:hypothetical protein